MTTTDNGGAVMVSLVRQLVMALVDEPESVRIEGFAREGCVVLEVSVAPQDLGKVIGKQGRTARSLRTILAAASMKFKVRCELNIREPREHMREDAWESAREPSSFERRDAVEEARSVA
jgi:uncharacterized protein